MVTAKLAVGIVCVCVLLVVIAWFVSTLSLDAENCRNMAAAYPLAAQLGSFNPEKPAFQYLLRDYYITTAYDACSPGAYKSDFVNVCALKRIISQGVRCLDFAVYTVNDRPVIATSDVESYAVKGSYNSVPFVDAMNVIRDHAFSGGVCATPSDPLLIHLRLNTRVEETFGKIARTLQSTFAGKLLGPRYSYQDQFSNFGKTKLSHLKNKVIIMVDQSNTAFLGTDLEEYVNIASNAPFMRLLRYTDGVLQCGDPNELIGHNKTGMSIVLPDRAVSAQNYPVFEAQKLGCQLCALAYQKKDANVIVDLDWFANEGTAFVLKPPPLRYIQVKLKPLPPLPADQSYAERKVSVPIRGITMKL